MYPLLRERANETQIYEQDPVCFEMMRHLGIFQTESSGHASEYSAYFRKRPDLVQKYDRNGYRGESGYYAYNWPEWRAAGDQKIRSYFSGADTYPLECSEEYASTIVEAVETHKPAVIYGNVLNTQLIENLPENGVVELACLVDKPGIQPTHFGSLPTQLAAHNQQHMAFHELATTAVLERNREAAIHALTVDPLTAAVCSLEEIRQLFDEMVTVQATISSGISLYLIQANANPDKEQHKPKYCKCLWKLNRRNTIA